MRLFTLPVAGSQFFDWKAFTAHFVDLPNASHWTLLSATS